jgi:hypothetical protein
MQFGDNGPNLGFGSPTWIFTRQNVSERLGVGAAAVGSAFTFGLWDGGNASCDASFQVSRTLGGIGRDALLSTVPVDRLLNGFAPDAAEMAANTLRFTEGTPVQMADGRVRPIQTVKTGDLVQTKDPQTGKIGAGKVTKTSVRQAPATVALKFSTGEVIECTPEHPFYVEGVGFTPAGQLGIGTSIVTRAGPAVQVTKVERQDAPVTVYNFTVQDGHTYFVGTVNGGLWVHNDCGLTTVLGHLEDTAVAKNWPNHNVLNISDWTLEKNMQWLQSAIDRGDSLYLASEPRPGPSVFRQELEYLQERGFVRQGDYMVRR